MYIYNKSVNINIVTKGSKSSSYVAVLNFASITIKERQQHVGGWAGVASDSAISVAIVHFISPSMLLHLQSLLRELHPPKLGVRAAMS